ncbi:hypothetical protein VNO80_22185 [Phaseolus coccineus]|uniref:Uncharacterized protein n=1 Tax=Phaseolus coccineus TaxID=3886 RepID=A0AAN9MA06_PHACN
MCHCTRSSNGREEVCQEFAIHGPATRTFYCGFLHTYAVPILLHNTTGCIGGDAVIGNARRSRNGSDKQSWSHETNKVLQTEINSLPIKTHRRWCSPP